MVDRRYGLHLPNFGPHASVEKLIEGTQKAEEYGFDFVVIRDHLIWEPHGMEAVDDHTHVETFSVLSAIAAVTDTIELGTAVAIPLRHPLHLAHKYASLSWLADGRTIAGIGAGNAKHEFDAVGLPYDKRPQLLKENVEILRKTWNEAEPSYDGEIFSFENAGVYPKPKNDIPIWVGGSSPASVRRAAEYGDGWFPGRINMKTFKAARSKLESLSEEQGRETPSTAAVPITSVDTDREKAIREANVPGLVEAANKRSYWLKPESGKFETREDLEGLLLAGTPEEIVDQVEEFTSNGLENLVFDLRMRLDEWHYCLDLLGEEVLPELPR